MSVHIVNQATGGQCRSRGCEIHLPSSRAKPRDFRMAAETREEVPPLRSGRDDGSLSSYATASAPNRRGAWGSLAPVRRQGLDLRVVSFTVRPQVAPREE